MQTVYQNRNWLCRTFLCQDESTIKTTGKVYISLFVCFATKAVHLGKVSSFTTEACIGEISSKVGSTGCDIQWQWYEIHRGTEWTNTTQAKSGEEMEFSISNCYNSLSTMYYDPSPSSTFRRISFSNRFRLVVQIEAVLNSRPFIKINSEPSDLEPLTPGHFLIRTSISQQPCRQTFAYESFQWQEISTFATDETTISEPLDTRALKWAIDFFKVDADWSST